MSYQISETEMKSIGGVSETRAVKWPSTLPDTQGGATVPSPLEDWRTRGTTPRPLPTRVSRQSNCSLSTTFPLIRLFFTGAVLIKGPLSTQNICSEVLLWLLMMPRIIKSGRNFQLHFAWSFLSAPCPLSPPFCSHLSFHPLTILPWCGYPPGN